MIVDFAMVTEGYFVLQTVNTKHLCYPFFTDVISEDSCKDTVQLSLDYLRAFRSEFQLCHNELIH